LRASVFIALEEQEKVQVIFGYIWITSVKFQ